MFMIIFLVLSWSGSLAIGMTFGELSVHSYCEISDIYPSGSGSLVDDSSDELSRPFFLAGRICNFILIKYNGLKA